jgi:hypothetical protein
MSIITSSYVRHVLDKFSGQNGFPDAKSAYHYLLAKSKIGPAHFSMRYDEAHELFCAKVILAYDELYIKATGEGDATVKRRAEQRAFADAFGRLRKFKGSTDNHGISF